MTQKPMLRVEVGALGAHQVKNIRGGSWASADVQGACSGRCGYFSPSWASHYFFEMDTVHLFSWWWALWCYGLLMQAASNPAQAFLGSRAGGSECDETHVPCFSSRLHRGSYSAIRKPVPLKPTPRRCRWHQRLFVALLSRPCGAPRPHVSAPLSSCCRPLDAVRTACRW